MKIPRQFILLYLFEYAFIAFMIFLIATSSYGTVGGGLIYIPLIGLFTGIYAHYFKDMVKPLTLFSILTLGLLVLSYLAFLEKTGGITLPIIIAVICDVAIIWYCVAALAFFPFRHIETNNLEEINLKVYVHGPFIRAAIISCGWIGVIGATLLPLSMSKNYSFLSNQIKLSSLAPVCFLLGIISIFLNSRKIPNDYVANLLRTDIGEETKYFIRSYKKLLLLPIICALPVGLIIENIRHDWINFFLNWTILLSPLIILKKTWRPLLENEPPSKEVDFDSVPRWDDPKNARLNRS